jgi:uncharacterized protein (TIRG00374 family)
MLGLVACAITVWVLLNNGDELLSALDNVRRVAPGWLVLAVIVEAASYVAYAAAERRLLLQGGASIGLLPLTSLSIAAQAAAFCIPGGVAVTAVVTYRILRRYRVDPGLAVSVLFMTSVLYMVALAALAFAAAPLAGTQNAVPDLRPISLGLLGVVGVLAGASVLLRRRGALAQAGRRVSQLVASTAQRTGLERSQVGPGLAEPIKTISFGAAPIILATALLLACWVGDAGCLALSYLAVGGTPPWEGLLLIYAAAQLAATLPITPGGLGVLEGSLTLGLVAFGGAQSTTLSAVLLYRLISFWGLLPTGGLAYLRLRRGIRPHDTVKASA